MTQIRQMQTAVGAGVVVIGLALAGGALSIPSAAGYGGVGPNFLPWVVAVSLTACGLLIVREALTGGFRAMEEPSGAERAYWPAFAWVSAGLLTNAALITTIGFILSCTICYALAVQGLRRAQEQPAGSPGGIATDLFTGAAIAAPVFWAFTKFLGINLPGLTSTGWI
jgi:putative tricarboxylic transport membrane protein